jgi:hypothetical protein
VLQIRTVVDQNKMGQKNFDCVVRYFCEIHLLGNKSFKNLKKKSVGIYFSLFIGINLRIRRFNLQS